jgi:glutathione S-transferase
MRLYVCWNTAVGPLGDGGHPCGKAYRALREAGHEPEVVKARGFGALPDALFNRTDGRREVRRLTGRSTVPVLVTDEDEVIAESGAIVAWAAAHPAGPRADGPRGADGGPVASV